MNEKDELRMGWDEGGLGFRIVPVDNLHVVNHNIMREIWDRYDAHLASFWCGRERAIANHSISAALQFSRLFSPHRGASGGANACDRVSILGDTIGHNLLCSNYTVGAVRLEGCNVCLGEAKPTQKPHGRYLRWILGEGRTRFTASKRQRQSMLGGNTRVCGSTVLELDGDSGVNSPARVEPWISRYYLDLYEWGLNE